jgi:hypothetical protein
VRTAPTRSAPDAERVALAAMMVRRAQLPDGVDQERAAHALAHTLQKFPPGTPHGGLIGRALRARTPAEKRQGPRPPEEVAIRALLGRGEPAYPRAVAAEAERRHARAVSRTVRREQAAERLAPLVDEYGHHAAALVSDHWQRYGYSPVTGWLVHQLGHHIPVSTRDAWTLVRLFRRAGYLAPRALDIRPGPRARKAAPRPIEPPNPSSERV